MILPCFNKSFKKSMNDPRVLKPLAETPSFAMASLNPVIKKVMQELSFIVHPTAGPKSITLSRVFNHPGLNDSRYLF